jgi:hypothetical protein
MSSNHYIVKNGKPVSTKSCCNCSHKKLENFRDHHFTEWRCAKGEVFGKACDRWVDGKV